MLDRGSPPDDFCLAPKTWDLLWQAKTVTVVTNSRSVPDDYFQTVVPEDRDVFVVFNRHRFRFDEHLASHTIWVHRQDEASGRFFGADDSAPTSFHHVRIAADHPAAVSVPPDTGYVSYNAALPGIADYPVGRRLLVPQRGIFRIVSPSTGFVVFALLDELQQRGAGFRVRAVGVGREYGGWPGHDWGHERRRLRGSTIDFRMPDGRADHWQRVLDHVPYELVRAARRLMCR